MRERDTCTMREWHIERVRHNERARHSEWVSEWVRVTQWEGERQCEPERDNVWERDNMRVTQWESKSQCEHVWGWHSERARHCERAAVGEDKVSVKDVDLQVYPPATSHLTCLHNTGSAAHACVLEQPEPFLRAHSMHLKAVWQPKTAAVWQLQQQPVWQLQQQPVWQHYCRLSPGYGQGHLHLAESN